MNEPCRLYPTGSFSLNELAQVVAELGRIFHKIDLGNREVTENQGRLAKVEPE